MRNPVSKSSKSRFVFDLFREISWGRISEKIICSRSSQRQKTNITEPFFSNDNAWFWAHLSCVFLVASRRPHFLWKIRTGISKFQRMSASSNWLYVRGQAAHVLLWCNDFHLHDGLLKWHVTDCDRKGGGLNAFEGSRNWFLSDHSEPSTSSTFLSCFPSGH